MGCRRRSRSPRRGARPVAGVSRWRGPSAWRRSGGPRRWRRMHRGRRRGTAAKGAPANEGYSSVVRREAAPFPSLGGSCVRPFAFALASWAPIARLSRPRRVPVRAARRRVRTPSGDARRRRAVPTDRRVRREAAESSPISRCACGSPRVTVRSASWSSCACGARSGWRTLELTATGRRGRGPSRAAR